jgi:hypothetical protein
LQRRPKAKKPRNKRESERFDLKFEATPTEMIPSRNRSKDYS